MEYAGFIQDLKDTFQHLGFYRLPTETIGEYPIDLVMEKEVEKFWTDVKYLLFVIRMKQVNEESISKYLNSIGEHITKRYTEDSTVSDFIFNLHIYRRRLRFSVIPVIVTDRLSEDMAIWINCTPVSLYYGGTIRPGSSHKDYYMKDLPVIFTTEDSTVNYDRIAPDKELENLVKKAFVPKIGQLKHVTKNQIEKGRRNKAFLGKKEKAAHRIIGCGVFLAILGLLLSFISLELLTIFLGGGMFFIIGGILGIIEVHTAKPKKSAKR